MMEDKADGDDCLRLSEEEHCFLFLDPCLLVLFITISMFCINHTIP